jgi:hypothetical protein
MKIFDKDIKHESLEEIKKSMEFIKDANIVSEIRIINTPKGTISGYYDNNDKLIQDIQPYIGKYNIYFTINPVKDKLIARSKNHLVNYCKITTSDSEIEKRAILMIDLDPKRPSGISSSDEEHKKAMKKAEEVKKFLSEQGWVEPIVSDSGNGAHILYKIDLSNDSESTEIIKKVLMSLDHIFSDDEIEVDKSTFNASRICKLYGTMACKGDNTQERPHRQSKIIDYPGEFKTVTKDQLLNIVSMLPMKEEKINTKLKCKFNLENWLEKYNIEVFQKKQWGRAELYVLKKCPWREEHKNNSSYIIQYENGAIAAGCHHNSCSDENWQTLRGKFEIGYNKKLSRNAKKDDDGKESQADVLIRLASEAEFFCDEIEEEYAAIEVKKHIEIHKIRSKKFRLWLTKKFFEETAKSPTADAMTQALNLVESKAVFSGNVKTLSRRCAEYQGKFYYDLGDNTWKDIVIDKYGWKIIDNPPILFKRNKNMKRQTIPERYDDISILNKHYRYTSNDDALLHKILIVTRFIPNIAHPILVLHGEKGSSKTTSMRKDREIVDPAFRDVVSMPTSKADLALILSNNYMPSFDNLDNITAEKSDLLCMAATGGAFSKRTLYTDEDETILSFKKPLELNGINIVATRADLLDRSILVELERIPEEERKEEAIIWKEFEEDKSKILGCIFTILSKSMKIYNSVELNRMGRMADFTRWGYAVAEAANIGGEKFLEAYINNQKTANDEAVESNPVALAVIKFMNFHNKWKGTVATLLGQLRDVAHRENIDTNSKLWANEPNVLSRRLKEVKSNLESFGVKYSIRKHGVGKEITLIKEGKQNKLCIPTDKADDNFDNIF